MSEALRRPAAVAGHFYPGDPARLENLIDDLLGDVEAEPARATAAVVPHAGLKYSGRCAAEVIARIDVTGVDSIVIVGPNHHGWAEAAGGASCWARGGFETPIGTSEVAQELAEALLGSCELVSHDPAAHALEHSIEVELPFLQRRLPAARVLPILLTFVDWDRCRVLAEAISAVAGEQRRVPLLLASSDMTHYESADSAARKDRFALESMENLDGERLLRVCRDHEISMCGRAPVAVVLEAARLLGEDRGRVVDYRHSGWVTGDDSNVVSYAGMIIP